MPPPSSTMQGQEKRFSAWHLKDAEPPATDSLLADHQYCETAGDNGRSRPRILRRRGGPLAEFGGGQVDAAGGRVQGHSPRSPLRGQVLLGRVAILAGSNYGHRAAAAVGGESQLAPGIVASRVGTI